MPRLVLFALAFFLALAAHAANPRVEVNTSQGTLTLELFADKAPRTVENFLLYVKEGFFDGTIFHRVIPGFMIQGGGHQPFVSDDGQIANEARNGLKNDTGTIAMARTSDPNSASAQFYINLVNNDGLNYPSPDGSGYAVFGRVVGGSDVVEKIAKVPTGNAGPHRNVPTTPVVIKTVKLLPEKK